MKVTGIEFRDGGISCNFDDGSNHVGIFRIISGGLMYLDGLSSIHLQALSDFTSKADDTALLDPRIDFCREILVSTDDPTVQDVIVANSTILWLRADSIAGVADGSIVIYWPSLHGNDGLSTLIEATTYTGGGLLMKNQLNGHSVIETAEFPLVDGICCWNDFGSLQVGDRPCVYFFVVKISNLSSNGILLTDLDDSGKNGVRIDYLGVPFGWRAVSYGESDSLSSSIYPVSDTDWHILSFQFLEAPDRSIIFWDGLVEQVGSTTDGTTAYTFSSGGGLKLFGNNTPDDAFCGSVAEIRIYEGVMSDGDREAIVNALATRYNL